MNRAESNANSISEILAVALVDLLDRVVRNGGLGEYTGGKPFAIKQARDALDAYAAHISHQDQTAGDPRCN
jgi:hypothetical protein